MFQIPESALEKNEGLFKFTDKNGKEWALPLSKYLLADEGERLGECAVDLANARQMREKTEKERNAKAERTVNAQLKLARVQREILDEYCPGLYATLHSDQVGALMTAWQEASGADAMGE